MTSDNVPGKPQGRSLRVALIVSLALNVLIIGGVASALIVSRHHGWHHHGRKAFGLVAFARTLPKERGDLILRRIEDQRAAVAPMRKAEREARDEARGTLMTEPFDKEKFKAALDKAADANAQKKRARMAVFADTISELTPEERHQLHEWFERRRKRFRRYHDDDRAARPPE